MKNLLLITLILISGLGFSQKVKVKKGLVTVDGIEVFKIVKPSVHEYIIYNLNGDELVFMNWQKYSDEKKITDFNKEGNVVFLTITFNEIEGQAEALVEGYTPTNKSVAKLLIKNGLINTQKGELITDKVKSFIKRRGTKHSDRMKVLQEIEINRSR